MSQQQIALFIFHRDLRLNDNTSLIKAIKDGYKVLPVFIFPPEQIDPEVNEYFSHPAVQFMCESLLDLNESLKQYGSRIHFFKDDNTTVLERVLKEAPIKAVYSNEDYSKYATERDNKIKKVCDKYKIDFIQDEDYGLLPLKEGLVDDERPYRILAQFYKRVLSKHTIRPVDNYKFKNNNFVNISFSDEYSEKDISRLYIKTKELAIHGGRTLGLKMLKKIKYLEKYKEERDFPALEKTTKGSPHLKYGTVSIREMYWTIEKLFGKEHDIIRELIFRDFYMKIYALQPELQRGVALYDAFDKKIPWSYDKKLFNAWKEGNTGFPLVDAGMRELNTTAHQHNRLRMLCGSVLTKYFLIDWRWGLKYYYQKLVDADIFSNTAGWGFVSSTGPDGVPYFRAPFNPYTQSKKFDKEAEYIKKWVPELKNVEPKDIHKWFDPKIREKYDVSYPEPIVDYKEASSRALTVFKKAFSEKYN